ncbi:MAG: hypothetical protein SGBAC_005433 [Bacillariaceae sp.]
MESQLLREAAAREATREAMLREAAFREARAAEAASALHSSRSLGLSSPLLGAGGFGVGGLGVGGLGLGGLSSLEYASLARSNLYGASALPLHLGGPSARAGLLPPTAGLPGGALPGDVLPGALPPLSTSALRADPTVGREHALRSIAHEEAILAATREQARRNLAHEEAIMAASRAHAMRNLAHEEAILVATREQARRNLAHEEALLAATREQARRSAVAHNAAEMEAASGQQQQQQQQQQNPQNPNIAQSSEARALSPSREKDRSEIVHDSIEDEALFEDKKLRSGKFTQPEEAYGDILIELFAKGLADVEKGTSLRTFLSKALHCAPMRVTKKIAGKGQARKNYSGRRENFFKVEPPDTEEPGKTDSDDEFKGDGELTEGICDKLWAKRKHQLADFYREFGIANLPIQQKYRDLRDFVYKVRTQYRKKQLSEERIREMNELGFIWSFRRFVPFSTRLEELRSFRQRHGHCRVPFRYKENPSFGLWASNMRARYTRHAKGKDSSVAPISVEQLNDLNALGFAWELNTSMGRPSKFQVQPNTRQLLINNAHHKTQFFMGQAMPKQEKLKSYFWDELLLKVEANLRALDRLYKQEEALHTPLYESRAGKVGAYIATRPIEEAPIGASGDKDDSPDDAAATDDDEHSYYPVDEDASIGSEASMGEDWSDMDFSNDDEYQKVKANLKALDQWYREEENALADEDEEMVPPEEQFASADEGQFDSADEGQFDSADEDPTAAGNEKQSRGEALANKEKKERLARVPKGGHDSSDGGEWL